MKTESAPPGLVAIPIGIDTHDEPVVYLHADSAVARSEGLESHSRVELVTEERRLIATLNVVHDDFLAVDEVGLSESAWRLLGRPKGVRVSLRHPQPVESFSHVRRKIYGHRLNGVQLRAIVDDIVAGRYSNAQIAAFVTAAAADRLDIEEIVHLTEAMVDAGVRLSWDRPLVADKHCVGGLPANRTTPIVVAIAACHDILIPKTSSRAITSPAGTADCMETLTRVSLSLAEMREVVEKAGACLAWGGSANLSPADDLLIRVERSLDIDSEGQLVASVLSKKKAAGATHVLIDIPVGPTAKVRSEAACEALADRLRQVAAHLDLKLEVVRSDGSQPIGRGIGPALEARDVLAVLENDPHGPVLLRQKSLTLAARLLALCGIEDGDAAALRTLESGAALERLIRICRAQGGFRRPGEARFTHTLCAERSGRLRGFDNRRLARAAKLAGAPSDKTAGLVLHVKVGDPVELRQPLMTLHAESPGELDYALGYAVSQIDMIDIEPSP